ncbi:hypothetical protein D3C81_1442820 [compost metagenome]
MREDGMAGSSRPADYQPYTAEEVTTLRAKTMLNLPGTRGELIKAMRAQGIDINDGMNY